MSNRPEIRSVNCVLLGSFNPTIFQPLWLKKTGLFRDEEVDTAEIKIIHKEICVFTISEIQFRIEKDRFQISSSNASKFELSRDLVIGIFSILEHTPVEKMGINTDGHFSMDSKEDWNNLGDTLVPKEPWVDLLDKPGMRSVLLEGKNPSCSNGYIRIKVEPSIRIPNGVYVGINNHFVFSDVTNALEAIEKVKEVWDETIKNSLSSMEKITEIGS